MKLLAAFTLCLTFAWGDYNSNNVQFHSHRRPFTEPERPIIRTTTEEPEQRPLIPEMAEVDNEKILEFLNRWCKFIDAKDIDGVLSMYADDLVFIKSGSDHALGKKDMLEFVSFVIDHSIGKCHSNFSLISGDYYYPYYWGHNYRPDRNGKLEVAVIFADVARLKEDGDYEIILSNMYLLDNHNQPLRQSNGYGEALPQSNGYGQTQAQRMEQPKYKISRPLPHFIPVPSTQNPIQTPLQLNGNNQIPQQTNKDDQAPQQTNDDQTSQQTYDDDDKTSQQTNENDQAPKLSNTYGQSSN